jgi:Putative Flp pilus-assembly TadE/G-like
VPGAGGADGGYVLIMTGLLLIPLLAFTAFAVDVGSWYAQGVKMQRAADAAALAGVVWAAGGAGSCPSQTYNCVAIDTAARNGYTITNADVTKISDAKISVTINASASMYFGSLFLRNQTLARSATAAYTTPVPMGSPSNQLGNDPDNGNMPQFWTNLSGHNSTRGNGDRYTSDVCASGEWQCPSGTNNEYAEDGYFYKVNVGTVASGQPLHISVYDPEFALTNDHCDGWGQPGQMPDQVGGTGATPHPGDTYTSGTWSVANVVAGSALDTVLKAYATPATYPGATGTDPNAIPRYDERYPGASSANSPGYTSPTLSGASFCPGDTNINGLQNLTTTYIVRAPDSTPLDDTDNPIICAISFSPHTQNVSTLLVDAAGAKITTPGGLEFMSFASVFHKYVNICTVPTGSVQAGDYLVQVRTNAKNPGSVPPTTTSTSLSSSISIASADDTLVVGGHNRAAFRANWGNTYSGAGVANLGVYADGRLPIYVNVPTNNVPTQFYLARIPPNYAGKILQLNLWDIGDGGSPNLTILPPPDATNPPTGCTWLIDGIPLPAFTSASISGCTASGMTSGSGDPSTSGFNGRLTQVQMAIPTNYTCDTSNPNNCWFKISIVFTSGTPADTTTWSANILGDPVHLTQ